MRIDLCLTTTLQSWNFRHYHDLLRRRYGRNKIRVTDFSISIRRSRLFFKHRILRLALRGGEGWETRSFCELGARCAEGKARERVPLSMP